MGCAQRLATGIVPALAALVFLCVGCSDANEESGDFYIDAQAALKEGDTERGIELLTKSIEVAPSVWAHFQRAVECARLGRDDMAEQDIQAVESLQPSHQDLPWLKGELKKPREKRFQGRNAKPPSRGK